jgi:signal peptidase I
MRGRSSAEVHALKCELAVEVLSSSGRLRFPVMGWSMLPAIFPGDTLVIEPARSESVGQGDIVLFRRDGRLFAHRVSGKSGSASDFQIVTQGDGMASPDPPVSSSQLLGKVSFVERDRRCLEPTRIPGLSMRAVSALVRRSSWDARAVVGVHKMGGGSQEALCKR